MPVTETSKSAYHWLRDNGLGGACCQRIFRAAINLGRCTRRQLEDVTGLRACQISGRVAELVESGHLVKVGYTICQHSGRMVEVLIPRQGVIREFLDAVEEVAA